MSAFEVEMGDLNVPFPVANDSFHRSESASFSAPLDPFADSKYAQDIKYQLYIKQQIRVHSESTTKMLFGRDMEEARELILDYLDGYILWLPQSQRENFKKLFYITTTCIQETEKHNLNDVFEQLDGFVEVDDMYVALPPNDAFSEDDRFSFKDYTYMIPKSTHVARKQLEAYLILWKTVYTMLEAGSHAANRIAQIFDWELCNNGVLFQLSRLYAFATYRNQEVNADEDWTVLEKTLKLDKFQFSISESDVKDFYQDGLSLLKKRKVNFDDLHECATFRITNDYLMDPHPRPPRLKPGWLKKTFEEPEGVKALVVGLRNQFNIVYLNVYLAMIAWSWYEISRFTLAIAVLVDGITGTLQFVLELVSRFSVYGFSNFSKRSLPIWTIGFQMALSLIAIIEIALYFATKSNAALLTILIISVLVRVIYHHCLFFFFPTIGKGHHMYRTRNKMQIFSLFLKNYCFFFLATAFLVPLYYLFIVPTLSRSATNFCPNGAIGPRIQCSIGVLGLWIPLVAVIFISNFIAFTIVLALFGAWLAHVTKVNMSADEGFSGIESLTEFGKTLKSWEVRGKNVALPYSKRTIRDKKLTSANLIDSKFNIMDTTKDRAKASVEQFNAVQNIWDLLITDLYDMDFISKQKRDELGPAFNWSSVKLGSRPRDVIQFWFSSLSALVESGDISSLPKNYLDKLPGLTQLVPSFGEAIIFDIPYLTSKNDKPVTNLEFLVAKYRKEWGYFYERMKDTFGDNRLCFGTSAMSTQPTKYIFPASEKEMLIAFLPYNGISNQTYTKFHPELISEIRLWASMRGQTLYRTIRGAMSYRMALRSLYEATNRNTEKISNKFQLILAHQQYGDPKNLRTLAPDIRLLYKKLSRPNILGKSDAGDSPFDLVFDWAPSSIDETDLEMSKIVARDHREIQKWNLTNVYSGLQDIQMHYNALKDLIDKQSSHCLIGKGGFPFGSVLAGLPRARRISEKAWLFGVESSPINDAFSMENSDLSCVPLGSGVAVYHSEQDQELGWLRIMSVSDQQAEGREHDFLLSRRSIHPQKESNFYLYPKYYIALDQQSGTNRVSEKRYYGVIKFKVRHLYNPSSIETFAIVSCLNYTTDYTITSQKGLYQVPMVSECSQLMQKLKEDNIGFAPKDLIIEDRSFEEFYNNLKSDAIESEEDLLNFKCDPPQIYLGIRIKHVIPRLNTLVLPVEGELPFSNPERIQGKPANQMNGLRYSFGLVVQTKDANQGGNFAEAVKFPLMLRKFNLHSSRNAGDHKHYIKQHYGNNANEYFVDLDKAEPRSNLKKFDKWGRYYPELEGLELQKRSEPDAIQRDKDEYTLPPVILGFRETIFTSSHGAVARYQGYAEWTFVTIIGRVLSKLNLRMHYGHPDFFLGSWIFSRASISKANPVYNLSEDIFAGYVALLNDRRSVHTDRIQEEKGRDTSLATTAIFNGKLAQGAASQMKSRDVWELSGRLDFVRQYLTFNSSLGYYFTTTAMLLSVKLYLLGLLSFSLSGYGAENLGNLQLVYSVPFLVQIGMFTLIPLLLEVGFEKGFVAILKVIIDLPLALGYFLFQGQTTTHYLVEAFNKGRAYYAPTGRLLGLSRKSLIDIYLQYGRSHFEPALDYLFYVVTYYIVAASRSSGFVPVFAPIICVVVFLIAPSGFQLSIPVSQLFQDVSKFVNWVYVTDDFKGLWKERDARDLKSAILKIITGAEQPKVPERSLQIYSIFNAFEDVKNTHWRVDMGSALFNMITLLLWAFQIVSVPGSMKDSILKMLVLMILLILLNIAESSVSSQQNKARVWKSISTIGFAFGIVYFIVILGLLNAWFYIGECIVGIFLSLKFLKSLGLSVFHIYAMFLKIFGSRKINSIKRQIETKRRQNSDDPNLKTMVKTLEDTRKQVQESLFRRLLGGLTLVDAIDRPVSTIGITVVLVPVHIVFNLIWAIPRLSHYLMYSTKLVPNKTRTPTYRPVYDGFNLDAEHWGTELPFS